MTRRPAAIAIAVLAAGALLSAQQGQVFRAETEGVSVNVSVRDAGKAVTGLKTADFDLRDNGVRQSIETLSVETLPIDVTLLLDVSESVEGQRLERLKYSVGETALLLRPDDRLRLIAVQHTLRQIFPFQPGGTKPNVNSLTAAGGTALYDGLVAAMMRAAEPDRPQLIIAYTDGQDTISIMSPDRVKEVAGFADAVVQLVVPTMRQPGSGRAEVVPAATLLNELATRTGGQLFLMDYGDRITDSFKRAIDEFRTSYVLRYVPSGVARGGWHELDVKVTSGSYEVRARKGYGG
ncbi:MAG TPA: VWA domain-containing protein [Vicinamibacterales bacterium]|nr:VWA domain-containing protein [Vicinamibacterales bacterium]